MLWGIIGLLFAALGATYWWRTQATRPAVVVATPASEADEEPVAQVVNPGYVGMQACVACHADRVAEFQATRHCLACCPPQPDSMPAAFSSPDAIYVTHDPALRFQMTRSGDEFFQTAILQTPLGEKRKKSRIDLVYGAGAGTDEVYLTWRGDLLYELPIAWLHPEHAWGASAFDPYGAGAFARELTPKCLECHNTWFEHAPGTLNEYKRETALLGVSCEKCHGPGREHVVFHEANRLEKSPKAIVRPARLSRERQLDLCAQCHSNAITYRSPAFSYLPGEPLDEHFRTLDTKRPEDDHVANQLSYLRESKCFKNSETLTCTTCHNPHKPRKMGGDAAQSACLECHQAVDCGKRERFPAAVQDNCVGCHMPVSKKVQVFFRTKDEDFLPPVNRYEHRIGIYPAAEQEVLLAWHRTQDDDLSRAQAQRLTATLNEHWLAEGDQSRQEHRWLPAIYAYRQALQLDPTSATQAKLDEVLKTKRELSDNLAKAVHLMATNKIAEAIPILQKVLEIDPEHAKAHGKLGAAYAATGQEKRAIEHLQASAKYDPDDPYGPGMLGWLAFLEGRVEESLKHYRRVEEIEPYNAQVNYQTGLALSKLNRWQEAESRFRQTLKIDPNHAGASQGLSHALRKLGKNKESLRFALRAASLTSFQNVDVLISLADSYADADRPVLAGETAAKALAAAQSGNAKLTPENRVRMELLVDRAKRSAKQTQ